MNASCDCLQCDLWLCGSHTHLNSRASVLQRQQQKQLKSLVCPEPHAHLPPAGFAAAAASAVIYNSAEDAAAVAASTRDKGGGVNKSVADHKVTEQLR